jgi:NAD(P)-dependent dehydrogenase (short-subunit alcohol dehydrogenase family)
LKKGLGLAIAKQLQAWGAATLVLVARNSNGKEVAAGLQTPQCRVVFVQADLGDVAATESVVSRALSVLDDGTVISGLVNAAATTARGNLKTETAQGFDRQFAINVRAPFLLTQAVARHLIERKATGSIVNITSCAAHGGAPFVMAYSASKAALVNLTKTNAAELAPVGIRVNAVNMGWCKTQNEDILQRERDTEWLERADASVPLGRILRPEDAAVTVAFLLSQSSAMTTGTILDLHPEFPHGMLSLQDTDER